MIFIKLWKYQSFILFSLFLELVIGYLDINVENQRYQYETFNLIYRIEEVLEIQGNLTQIQLKEHCEMGSLELLKDTPNPMIFVSWDEMEANQCYTYSQIIDLVDEKLSPVAILFSSKFEEFGSFQEHYGDFQRLERVHYPLHLVSHSSGEKLGALLLEAKQPLPALVTQDPGPWNVYLYSPSRSIPNVIFILMNILTLSYQLFLIFKVLRITKNEQRFRLLVYISILPVTLFSITSPIDSKPSIVKLIFRYLIWISSYVGFILISVKWHEIHKRVTTQSLKVPLFVFLIMASLIPTQLLIILSIDLSGTNSPFFLLNLAGHIILFTLLFLQCFFYVYFVTSLLLGLHQFVRSRKSSYFTKKTSVVFLFLNLIWLLWGILIIINTSGITRSLAGFGVFTNLYKLVNLANVWACLLFCTTFDMIFDEEIRKTLRYAPSSPPIVNNFPSTSATY